MTTTSSGWPVGWVDDLDPVRAGIVDGLRSLADAIEADERIPLGRYAAAQGITVPINAPDADTVRCAAEAADATVDTHMSRLGELHTTALLAYGPVTFQVFHIRRAS